jgi:metal transporter CNNM
MRPTSIRSFTSRSFPPADHASGEKWIIVTDLPGEPAFVLDSHRFMRDALFNQSDKNQGTCWHRPIIVRDMQTRLGDVIGQLKVSQTRLKT